MAFRSISLRIAVALAVATSLAGCQSTRQAASAAGIVGCSTPGSSASADPIPVPDAAALPDYEPTYDAVRGQSAALDAAVAAYDAARFQEAATQFANVAASSSPEPVRRLALRLLGRTRLALNDGPGAAEALRQLVAMEPPMVRLNPDVEPLRLMETYYDVRHGADGSYAVRTDRARTLAVADFTNASVTDYETVDPLRLGFASLMIDRLRGASTLELVERVRLQWLLDELSLGAGEDAGRRAGQLLGADQVVFGTYIKSQNTLLMTARVVDVASGRILLGERVSGPADRFDEIVGCLSDLVARAVDARLPRSQATPSAESLDAVIAYARGLALEEAEDYDGAAAQYQMALQLSPGYPAAQQRLDEALGPFMAANMNR